MLDKNRPELKEASFMQAIGRPGFLKFLIAFVVILLVAWLGYSYVVSRDSRIVSEHEEFIETMEQSQKRFDADTYGGVTPRETLDLFISALEAGDPQLAALYFEMDDSGSRTQWEKVMQDTYDAGNFPKIADALTRAVVDEEGVISDSFYRYMSVGEEGVVVIYVELEQIGNLWKITGI